MFGESEIGHAWLNVTLEDGKEGGEFTRIGIIEDVFISDKYRSKGLGSELLQEVIEVAKEKRCVKLLALSRFENTRAHTFYERLGFTKYGLEFRMNL